LLDVEDSSIAPYVLKMSIVQAGAEVMSLGSQHTSWAHESQGKLAKLVRGQEDSMAAKKKLAQANAMLHNTAAYHTEQARNVIQTVLTSTSKMLLKSIIASWLCHIRREKMEQSLHDKYAVKLEQMQEQISNCRGSALANVRSLFARQTAQGRIELLKDVFEIWNEEAQEIKAKRGLETELKGYDEQLLQCKAEQASRMKTIVQTMAAGTDSGLKVTVFNAWRGDLQELKQERLFDQKVAGVKVALQKRSQEHTSRTLIVLQKVATETDATLMQMVFKTWSKHWQEIKQSTNWAELLQTANSKLSNFGARNAKSAGLVMGKASAMIDEMLVLKVFNCWKLETRLQQVARSQQTVIEGKRAQLQNVHTMFRSFAVQLEDTAKDLQRSHKTKSERKMLSKSDGTVSLPNIHERPPSGGGQFRPKGQGEVVQSPQSQADRQQAKQAWK